MAIATIDLTSELVDLTSISLRDLRSARTPALLAAIRRVLDDAARESSNDIQNQAQ